MKLRQHLLIALCGASLLCTWRASAPAPVQSRAAPRNDGMPGLAPSARIDARSKPGPRGPEQTLVDLAESLTTAHVRDLPELEHTIAAELSTLVADGHIRLVQAAVARWAGGPDAIYLGFAPLAVVAEALGRESPVTAFSWLSTLPESHGRDAALERVIVGWALADPRVALACAQTFRAEDTRRRTIVQALEPWLAREPLDATRWLAEHESDPLIDQIIADVIAGSFGQSYPQLALHWARVIADPDVRGQATASLERRRRLSAAPRRFPMGD